MLDPWSFYRHCDGTWTADTLPDTPDKCRICGLAVLPVRTVDRTGLQLMGDDTLKHDGKYLESHATGDGRICFTWMRPDGRSAFRARMAMTLPVSLDHAWLLAGDRQDWCVAVFNRDPCLVARITRLQGTDVRLLAGQRYRWIEGSWYNWCPTTNSWLLLYNASTKASLDFNRAHECELAQFIHLVSQPADATPT